jgi:hypothetical protein
VAEGHVDRRVRITVDELPSTRIALIGVADSVLGNRADEVHAPAVLRMLGVARDDARRVAALEMRSSTEFALPTAGLTVLRRLWYNETRAGA